MRNQAQPIIIFCFLIIWQFSIAQNEVHTNFYGPEHFLIEGTVDLDMEKESPYDRFPEVYKGKVRGSVWNLSKSSAGVSIRFLSNSSQIRVRWTLLNNIHMNHMADTGSKGVDLYHKNNGVWQYVNTGRPSGKTNEATLVSNLPSEMREYKIYLPLYDGVTKLEVGIDEGATIKKAAEDDALPIVFYGTSITQGGCASRAGMVHTSIMSRKLGVDCLNFGFSGNGKMEQGVVELLSLIDASVFVVECVPNMKPEEVETRTIPLVQMIRTKQPTVPIVFVENVIYESSFLDVTRREVVDEKNGILREKYDEMMAQGFKNVYYVGSEGSIGDDHEGTVDGVHFTDLGFLRYADFLIAELTKLRLVGN